MIRLILALTACALLTLAPMAYEYSLKTREPADFAALSEKLQLLQLTPEGWEAVEGSMDLSEEWRERLGLHDNRSVDLIGPDGRRLHVLLMLSETGEQLYHTPDICYAAHGCEVRGDVAVVPLQAEDSGYLRAVQVVFDKLTGGESRVVAFGYWAGGEWVSPTSARILNELGREPFLLKLQLLVDHHTPDDDAFQERLNEYMEFLGDQLRGQKI